MLFRISRWNIIQPKRKCPRGHCVTGLALLLFLVKPVLTRIKNHVTDIAKDMDAYIDAAATLFDHLIHQSNKKQSISRKDQLFTDRSANSWQQALWMMPGNFLERN